MKMQTAEEVKAIMAKESEKFHKAAVKHVKSNPQLVVDTYFAKFKEVGDLLNKLTPVDSGMIGLTFEEEVAILEEKYQISREEVNERFKLLASLYEAITGINYYDLKTTIYECVGFAVINDYAMERVTVG